MKEFVFICVLFCGVSGFTEILEGSVSAAAASLTASGTVNTVRQSLDIVEELNKIRKDTFGKKRERRFAEISASLANASSDPTKVVNTAKDVLYIVEELDKLRQKHFGKNRERRGAELSGSLTNASNTASKAVGTAKDVLDIVNELDDIRKNRKSSGKKRQRRFSESITSSDSNVLSVINKVVAGFGAVLNTYYRRIAHGNFKESAVRGYSMLQVPEGKSVFGTLDGDLNLSYRSIWNDRYPRTGDIISCRIPSDRMAEHYMMVLNEKIIEASVDGGKSSDNGVIMLGPWTNSSYIESTECLHHENRLVSRAEEIDDKNGNHQESEHIFTYILERINCTVNGRNGENTGNFRYDIMTCNCQDLVLYWAYGYVESDCLRTAFNGCSAYKTSILRQIVSYVDPNALPSISPSDYARAWGVMSSTHK